MKTIYLYSDFEKSGKKITVYEHLTATFFPLHFHDYIEITIFVEGTGKTILNGSEYDLIKNTCSILTIGDSHSIYNISPQHKFFNIRVHPSLFSPSMLKQIELFNCKICNLDDNSANQILSFISALNYSLLSKVSLSDKYYTRIINCILEIFIACTKTNNNIAIARKNEDSFFDAVLFINANFKKNISLKIVAKHINYNETYFSNIFKKKLGVSFAEYLSELRINFAKQLLVSTDYNLSYIIYESGFSSNASFFRNFKNIVGLSPTKYKQMMQKIIK